MMNALTSARRASLARRARLGFRCGLALLLVLTAQTAAHALIRGGEGSAPVEDPGWPAGADKVFNTEARVAWWEGPPFGGGQWHAECRGDAAAFNQALEAFAAIDAKQKRLVVHNGVGHSFWLNPNREPEKQDAARTDWVFVIWQPDRWQLLQQLPADFRPRGEPAGNDGPVPQIDVYTGGSIRWEDVHVPDGIEVVDERLEAHGFTPADGTVLEGTVVDLQTKEPLVGRVRLERIEPQTAGGSAYANVRTVDADDAGHWILKNVPAGRHRLVIEADGYVQRIGAYAQHDGQPRWSEHNTGLSKRAPVLGRVVDTKGEPLAEVKVSLQNVVAEPGGRYETGQGYQATTGADGRFQFSDVPIGRASVSVHKSGWCRPGLGLPIETPADDVELTMQRAATLLITVDFDGADLEGGYIVRVVPEAGEAAGRWSASGNIDANFSTRYQNIPPGRYVVTGRPNPGNDTQETDPVTVELVGGESMEVILKAK